MRLTGQVSPDLVPPAGVNSEFEQGYLRPRLVGHVGARLTLGLAMFEARQVLGPAILGSVTLGSANLQDPPAGGSLERASRCGPAARARRLQHPTARATRPVPPAECPTPDPSTQPFSLHPSCVLAAGRSTPPPPCAHAPRPDSASRFPKPLDRPGLRAPPPGSRQRARRPRPADPTDAPGRRTGRSDRAASAAPRGARPRDAFDARRAPMACRQRQARHPGAGWSVPSQAARKLPVGGGARATDA